MKKQTFSTKTAARAFAFKFVYRLFLKDFKNQLELYKSDLESLSVDIQEFEESYIKEDEEHNDNELNPSVQSYGNKLIKGLILNFEDVKTNASQNILKRSFDSIDPIEKTVISLGIYELLFEETPSTVVINEYINIVKIYGKEDSKNFVNGLLDKVSKTK